MYAKAPVSAAGGPEQLLKYLARYVAGVAISDKRLVSLSGDRVTFRWWDYRTGQPGEPTSLPVLEFIRRLLMHVLPDGFMRVRYYGLYANRATKQELPRCRKLLGLARASAATGVGVVGSEAGGATASEAQERRCPSCGRGRQLLWEESPRRNWWDLLGMGKAGQCDRAASRVPAGPVASRRTSVLPAATDRRSPAPAAAERRDTS